jgi:flagellar basal body-associated protein FliL
MAEKEKDKKAETSAPEAGKKKLPIKTVGIVAAIMILEGAGVFMFVSMSGKAPQTSEAGIHEGEHGDLEESVEVPLVDDRFQNMQTGNVWIWKLEVYLKVKKKNEEAVNKVLEERSAEIKASLSQLMRRMQHTQLKEPDLRTLTRQLTALINEKFGYDKEIPRVDEVIVANCEGFAAPQ